MALPSDSPEVLKTVADARSSLDFFFDTFAAHKTTLGVFFAVKIAVKDGDTTAHLWYSYRGEEGGLLLLEHFELPKELVGHESKKVQRNEIEDWMINDHGHLYGGFSIRLQRSKTPKEKQAEFDDYSGIRVYKIIDYQKRIDLTPTN
jgi:uncharacterized protein YegJ (DUF2314 family)